MTAADNSIDEALREAAPELLAHINDHHDDALLLMGRILGDRREATAATATGIDPRGLDLVLGDGAAERTAPAPGAGA